jgi:hypothetical protein
MASLPVDLMPVEGSIFILALCAFMAYFLTAMLTWAALRNHFWRHTTRPVVIASAVLFLGFGVEFTKRALLFIVPQGTPLYTAMARSGVIADAINLLLLVGMIAWFFVAVIMYPDMRRGPGEPHDRTSHAK